MEDINHLVVTPFRDISIKATEALNNAGENQDMHKAAQKLAKEGERALKRIEPLCTKLQNEYGDNFLNALRENTEIANFRTQLNDLLWDFDDYTEQDEFDAEKYSELQALSRQAAPKVYDVLISMKLEAPMRRLVTELSPPSSPLPPPSFPIHPVPSSSQSTRSSRSSPHSSITPRQFQSVSYATGQLANYHDRQPSGASDATRPPPTAPPVQPPPRPPSANPWDHTVSTLLDEDAPVESGFRRRPTVVPVDSNSPVQATASPASAGQEQSYFTVRRPIRTSNSPAVATSEPFSNGRHEWQRNPSPQYTTQPESSPPQHRPFTASPAQQQFSDDPEQYGRAITSHSQDIPSRMRSLRHASQALSTGSSSSAVDEHGREDMVSPEMGGIRPRATSMAESIIDPYLAHVRMSDHSQASAGRPPNRPMTPTQHIDSGLIVVERDVPPVTTRTPALSQQDCSIGSSSSFYVCKGFCDGAKEVIVGGIGVKKSRKPVGFTGASTVARCTSCCYELDFQDIENDVSKLDVGNRKMCGIGYRLRFLQKCHVGTKRVDDILYGCPFCVHMNRTIDASDATVFFNSKALFSHLARHPRPLPEVPGFVVVEQAEVPPELRNDYDLHFKHPTVEHPVLEHEEEISALPSGFSREPTRRMYGQRLLGDRTPALEMVTGGHVTGITWPAKYNGEWAFGWYDAAYASVPTDALKLVAPPERDIKLGGTSNVRAKARWKFSHKDKDKDWLKFDKNEVITNIGWPYPEHWCWSGTNAKGKWGIFPQAFIDTNTVQELTAAGSDRANKVLDERNKSSHIIPRFSIRKAQGPPSIASSTRS